MAKTYFMRFGFGDARQYTGLAPTMVVFTGSGTTFAGPAITESITGSGIYQFTYGTTTPIAFVADGFTTSLGTQGRYVSGSIDPSDRADEYGNTLIAYGLTNIALGTTNVALGTTIISREILNLAQGSTILAIGTTSLAYGMTDVAIGMSNYALGQTTFAQGTTILAVENLILAQGLSLNVVVSGLGSTASSYGTQGVDPVDAFGYLKRILENLEGNQTFVKNTGALSIYSRGSTTLLRVKTVSNTVNNVTKSGL